jgi:hypothetical protein
MKTGREFDEMLAWLQRGDVVQARWAILRALTPGE